MNRKWVERRRSGKPPGAHGRILELLAMLFETQSGLSVKQLAAATRRSTKTIRRDLDEIRLSRWELRESFAPGAVKVYFAFAPAAKKR